MTLKDKILRVAADELILAVRLGKRHEPSWFTQPDRYTATQDITIDDVLYKAGTPVELPPVIVSTYRGLLTPVPEVEREPLASYPDVLTWDAAAPILDYEYESEYCHPFFAWTERKVIFACLGDDGDTYVVSVPRSPINSDEPEFL